MTDRRDFLKLAAGAGTASLAAACSWDGGDVLRPKLLAVSRVNDWVGEHILFSPTRLAKTYDSAERSANFPSYFISPAMPFIKDPGAWRLRVDGLVQQKLLLSLGDLMMGMPRVSYTVKHHCVEGWTALATWHGVPVSTIVERCRPLAAARYIRFTSFDSDYFNGWDLASLSERIVQCHDQKSSRCTSKISASESSSSFSSKLYSRVRMCSSGGSSSWPW